MPLYEYLCRDCESQHEMLVRSGEAQPECPQCGGERLMKLLSVPAAHSGSSASGGDSGPPAGSCGTGCGCFPG